tara:strand:- start:394 stop:1968 length:1575 start_codon:yes stop_codon:yes gene_type:complete
MKKISFSLLIFLMTAALIGIILVQSFWIKTTIDTKERQFSLNVNQALKTVTDDIKSREMSDYLAVYQKLIDSIGTPKESHLTSVFQYVDRNQNTNKTYIYSQGILEDDYNITSNLIEPISDDSLSIIDYTKLKTTTIIDEAFDREMQNMTSIERLQRVEKMSLIDQAKYSSIFSELAELKPIHKRVSNVEIELLLQKEFKDRDLDLDFDYRVFNGELATKVGSDRYTNLEGLDKYSMPIFEDDDGVSEYSLVVGFPNRTLYLRSSISYLIILSILFTLTIILSFYFTILNSIKQKNISEMKTDFINNMTHEFKTPIATIDLALNAVKNEKIKGDEKLKNKYLNIINEENKRMNKQVENVLKISQLDKNKITLTKKEHDLHDVINQAASRISLLLKTRNANINLNYNAKNSIINLSYQDMINVFVNIFENSIKYSATKPLINVNTSNKNNQIIISVKDNGMGISKAAKSKIFDKFYRVSQGDIHNVKGHGLGLSFVKKIMDLHSGTISVSSEIGKGTDFKIIFDI